MRGPRARAAVVTGSVLVVALGAFLGLLPADGVSVTDGTCGTGFLPSTEPACLAAAGWLRYGAWGLTVLGAAVIAGAVAVTFAGVRTPASGSGGRRSVAGPVRAVTDTSARLARRYNGVIIAVASVAVVAGAFLGLLPIAAAPGTAGPASVQACGYESWCVPGGPAERPAAARRAGDDPRPLTPTSWGDPDDWRLSASSALTSLGVLGLFLAVAPPVLAGVARGSLRRRAWTRGTTVVALTALAGLAIGGGLLLGVRQSFALRTYTQHSAVAHTCAEQRQPVTAQPGPPADRGAPGFPGTHPGYPYPTPSPGSGPLPDPPLRPDPPFPGDPRVPDPSAPPGPSDRCERVEQVPNYPAWGLVALGALALAAARGVSALGSRTARAATARGPAG